MRKSTEEVDDIIYMTTSEILAHAKPVYIKKNVKLADNMLQDNLSDKISI